MFNWFKKETYKKDELILVHEYVVYGSYSEKNKRKVLTLPEIFEKFRKNSEVPKEWGIFVKSEYNGITYPMFDLDTIEHKDTFEKLYANTPYVIFQSSPDHYWGILGIENKNIFTDTYWLSCNDTKFVSMSKERCHFTIRGLYEELDRKPILYNSNLTLSHNFQEFINKFQDFIKNEAMELSILKYKNPQMMLKFDRKRKLDKINVIL